jgi:hypothetical protein
MNSEPQLASLRDELASSVGLVSQQADQPLGTVASAPCDGPARASATQALKKLWKWPMAVAGLPEASALGIIKLLKAVKRRHPDTLVQRQAAAVFDKWLALAATAGGETSAERPEKATGPTKKEAVQAVPTATGDKGSKRAAVSSLPGDPQQKRAAVGQASTTTAITFTFCECGENHHGNQMVGSKAAPGAGFDSSDLEAAVVVAKSRWGVAEARVVDLSALLLAAVDPATLPAVPTASILVLCGGGAAALRSAGLSFAGGFEEALTLPWDTKYLCPRRKKVLNKLARSNNVVADTAQGADYAAGKGTIVAFDSAPHLAALRAELGSLGPKFGSMIAEGNQYGDGGTKHHGIGLHGDSERRRVCAVRLGSALGAPSPPMHFQWFLRHAPVGPRIVVPLSVGDAYALSEAAVGTHWKCSSRLTLRHATGADKFTKPVRAGLKVQDWS